MITFSQIQLTTRCLGSCVLPQSKTPSEAAAAGTAKHEHLARIVGGMTEAASLEAAPHLLRAELELNDWGRIAGRLDGCESERAYAYDVQRREGRYLGANLNRRYNAASSEFAGAIDYVGELGEREPLLIDLKTGHIPVPIEGNWQMRAAAVAVAKTHRLSQVRVAILSVRAGFAESMESAAIGALELAQDAALLSDLHRAICDAQAGYAVRGDLPALALGDHCKYCPSKTYCPAFAGAASQLAAAPEQALTLPLDTREQRSAAYRAVRHAERLLAHLKQQLAAAANIESIQVEPGVLWGPIERSRETIDAQKALPMLSEYVGRELAISALDMLLSKTAMRRALVAHTQAGGSQRRPTELERELLEQLRAAGAIERKTTSTYHEHKGCLPPQPNEITEQTK